MTGATEKYGSRNGDVPDGSVSLFALSRRMGTSLQMIDLTYGHLAPDAEEQERILLDAYEARPAVGSLNV